MNQGRPAAAAAARAALSTMMWSSWTWVTERPLWAWTRIGSWPKVKVWKWNMRLRPIIGCSRPERSRSRGVSMAPAATITCAAVSVWVLPAASIHSTPVARPLATTILFTNESGRSSARPVRSARRRRRHRVALGVDGAAEERAEAAVVAGRPAVVGDRVAAVGAGVGVVAEPLGRGGGDHGAVHRGARGHRVGTRAPRGEGVGARRPRPPRPRARPRRSTARVRRSRAASRRRWRPPPARARRGPGSRPPESAAACRRRGPRPRRPWPGGC